ncbi:hypothetical protein CPBF426_23430 [Xanthomonas arboricola pv. juglandis]|nr:hypothetical protein CPBF426_23430 [Xanthomonas arboricola pv. juglandis]
MMSSFRASASRPSDASLVVEESACELPLLAGVVDVLVGCRLWPYEVAELPLVLFDVEDGA